MDSMQQFRRPSLRLRQEEKVDIKIPGLSELRDAARSSIGGHAKKSLVTTYVRTQTSICLFARVRVP